MTPELPQLPEFPEGVTVTYQQQRRKCGKPTCDCRYRAVAIHGHGPYWYAYWRDRATGRMRSRYIGKRLPEELERVERIKHAKRSIISEISASRLLPAAQAGA